MMNPIVEHDSNGNIIHETWEHGQEIWYEYDSNGKLRYEKWSNGYEYWRNSNGKLNRYKDPYGYEYWFDSNGLHVKQPNTSWFHRLLNLFNLFKK